MDHGRYVINKLIIMVDVIKINENIKVLEVRIFSILNCFLSILKLKLIVSMIGCMIMVDR